MNEPHMLPARRRDRLYTAITLTLGVLLLPAAFLRHPGRARELACAWALRLRFPAEDLTGLSPGTLTALTTARTEAFWRDHQLIGVTSGHRDAATQLRLFLSEVRRSGSPESARTWVLPPSESKHVRGIALDVRPVEGARWLERHGGRHHLYRIYANEWWHFEYQPHTHSAPPRLPHPGAITRTPQSRYAYLGDQEELAQFSKGANQFSGGQMTEADDPLERETIQMPASRRMTHIPH
jgi:zinc D-Ala-D-Ala carboxypeptidase